MALSHLYCTYREIIRKTETDCTVMHGREMRDNGHKLDQERFRLDIREKSYEDKQAV